MAAVNTTCNMPVRIAISNKLISETCEVSLKELCWGVLNLNSPHDSPQKKKKKKTHEQST